MKSNKKSAAAKGRTPSVAKSGPGKTLDPQPDHIHAAGQPPVLAKGSPTVWLSVANAATRAGYSQRTIKRWVKAGYLHAARAPSPKGMGHLRIRLGDLESLIARGALN